MDLLTGDLDTGWEGPTRVPKADTVLSWEVDRVQKRSWCLAATLDNVSQVSPVMLDLIPLISRKKRVWGAQPDLRRRAL